MDFSHPTFYHMRLKGELPRVVVLGRRMRINVGMVNELESFRGEDIFNECPIPLRIVAIPLEDENANPKHEMDVEIMSRNIRVKPLLLRSGTGTAVINIHVAPVPIPEDGIPFLLKVSVSNKCRIFNQIIPACSAPLLLVPPDSPIALKMFEQEEEAEAYDDDDYEFDDEDFYEDYEEDMEEDMEEIIDVQSMEAFYSPKKSSFGVGDDDEDEDDEDMMFDDEDFEFDDEDDDEAAFSDDDLYEVAITEKQYRKRKALENQHDHDHDHDHEDEEGEEEVEQNCNYHAFVADSLSAAPAAPIIAKEFESNPKATKPKEATTNSAGISIQGSQFRRAKVLPATLLNKRKAQTEAETPKRSSAETLRATKGEFKVGHRTEGIGMTLMNAPGLELFDPVCGAFDMARTKSTSTQVRRKLQQEVSWAYIKELSGNELGCRIWDGSIYLVRFFVRLLRQNQTWIDGLRSLELGSGTGVAGIYLWHMIAQRAAAQVKFARAQVDLSMDSLNDAFALLSFRDHESLHDNQVQVTTALNKYGTKQPLVAVTDLDPVLELLRSNVKVNQTTKFDMFSSKTNPLITHGSPSGLHVFDLPWGNNLDRPILKLCGISIEHGRGSDFSNPEVGSFMALPCFDELRKSITKMYSAYRSLRKAAYSEPMPLQSLYGLDMVFASECLYNDNHFSSLRDSIFKLYLAHAFGHAQVEDAKKRGEIEAEKALPKTFPIVLLSYRIRALEEEEGIIDGFFKPLEDLGIYHTSIPFDRVLSPNEEVTLADSARAVHDQVHQRLVDRVARENDIPNVLGALEKERLKTTRLAVMYACPNKWMPTSSCDPALYEQHDGSAPPSPLPLLSTNGAVLFKLFQAL